MWVAFALFSAKIISIYVIFYDQNFNDTLTNDIVNFEKLAPGKLSWWGPGDAVC